MRSSVCYGHSLALPLESGSALIHRILQSNPARSHAFIDQRLDHRLYSYQFGDNALKLKAAERRLIGNYLQFLDQKNMKKPEGSSVQECIGFTAGKKYRLINCPECAKALYHTNLFDLPCVDTCPIHHTPLVDTCPECQSEWPVGLMILKSSCQLCGLKSDLDAYIQDREQLKQQNFFDLVKLNQRLVTAKQSIEGHFEFTAPTMTGIASFQSADAKNRVLLGEGINHCLRDKRLIQCDENNWEIKKWTLFEASKKDLVDMKRQQNREYRDALGGHLYELPQELFEARLAALHWAVTHCNHNWFKLPEEPFLISPNLNSWIFWSTQLIAHWLYFPVIPFYSNVQNHTLNNISGAYAGCIDTFPKIPFPKKILYFQGRCYLTSLELQAYLYEYDLREFYKQIYYHFQLLEHFLLKQQPIPTDRLKESFEWRQGLRAESPVIMIHKGTIFTILPPTECVNYQSDNAEALFDELMSSPFKAMQKHILSISFKRKEIFSLTQDIHDYFK
ncbi:MAG: hypothetical protein HWE16_05490 [Gammaproteobacteria bacterium]|nr:hypothetical protein [Gammaproteobacteria bacterium]